MSDNVQQARLRALLEAEQKILKSQEWQDGNIKSRRADYDKVRQAIEGLRSAGVMLPEEMSSGGNNMSSGRTKRVILLD